MRRHKGRRVHFPKRVMTSSQSNIPTTSESRIAPIPLEVPPGFVIQEIDDEIQAESGDISEEGSSSTPRTTSNSASTRSKPRKNIFPITRNWNTTKPKGPDMASLTAAIPSLFTTLPPIRDLLQTQTSAIQDEIVQTCLPFLSNPLNCNSHGIPRLLREKHIRFLHKALEPLPAPYTTADAARPWLLYWALSGLSTMGEDVSQYRERIVETVRSMQNPTGGFGGGFGQLSHLAPTYAVVLALGIVGCAGDAGDEVLRETMRVIDRRGMWEWLGRLKCADGGFMICEGGEKDVRGAYIAAVIMTLLSLPLAMPPASTRSRSATSLISSQPLPPSIKLLTDMLPDYVSRCQTFEGGISAQPNVEAHGAYAFCALACLSILFRPTEIVTRKLLDIPKLINWLSARQYGPEGGFAGRTNKLVDGCYSHWVGGCWPLIEAALSPSPSPPSQTPREKGNNNGGGRGMLYSREGLIRYIMCCCQDTGKRGGLRDKPGKSSDSYHTCYVLAGLSSAMWQNHYSNPENPPSSSPPQTESDSTTTTIHSYSFKAANYNDLTAPYGWTGTPYSWDGNGNGNGNGNENSTGSKKGGENVVGEGEGDGEEVGGVGIDESQIFDEEDRVEWIHPVFVVPRGVAERVRGLFLGGRDEWVE